MSVVLRGVHKEWADGQAAVRGVDLDIERGSFVVFVGPSGCGKSTLLQLIAGLERPTRGSIAVEGEPVGDRIRPDVAMVFQSYALYPHLDVRRNIGFPLEVAGVARTEIDRRVEETAERLGLGALLDRKPKDLSGGERQRVALGRAIVRRPRVCLLDEPLSNLDPSLRARMRAELKALHAELGATFIHVTHDQAEAMTLADRVVVLERGLVRQVGAPREVYDRPIDTFVAEFFGAPKINLLPGDEGELLGVRPEDVVIADRQPGRPGRVTLIEPMGADTFVTLDASITGRGDRDRDVAIGDACFARFDPARAMRFDARTGRLTSPRTAPSPRTVR